MNEIHYEPGTSEERIYQLEQECDRLVAEAREREDYVTRLQRQDEESTAEIKRLAAEVERARQTLAMWDTLADRHRQERDQARAKGERERAELREIYSVQGRLGAYLNTMVVDLEIDGKGQYLRDLFGEWEKELEAALASAREGSGGE